MTAMSQPGENASGKAIRLEARRVERRVPGIGTAVFRAPSVDDEMRLAQFYDAQAPDHRAFVNQTVAATLQSPGVLIAREAGARVLDHDGSEHSEQSRSTIAVTPALEVGLMEAVRATLVD